MSKASRKFLGKIFVWFINVFVVELSIPHAINLLFYDKWSRGMIDTWATNQLQETTNLINSCERLLYDHERTQSAHEDVENLISSCNQLRMLCKFTSASFNKHVLHAVCSLFRICGFVCKRKINRNLLTIHWQSTFSSFVAKSHCTLSTKLNVTDIWRLRRQGYMEREEATFII